MKTKILHTKHPTERSTNDRRIVARCNRSVPSTSITTEAPTCQTCLKAIAFRKYAVHQGTVRSRNDGEYHTITFNELVRLYRIDRRDAIDWLRHGVGKNPDDFIHLYPDSSGRYVRPDEVRE